MHPTSDPEPSSERPRTGLGGRLLARARRLLDDLRSNEGGPRLDWKTLTVLLVTPVLLTVFYYYGRPDYYRVAFTLWGFEEFGADWPYQPILPYAYWAAASIALRIVIPILLIWFVFRQSVGDFGWRIRGTARHLPIYLGLLVVMLPFLYYASTQESFLAKYPFYDGASRGGGTSGVSRSATSSSSSRWRRSFAGS